MMMAEETVEYMAVNKYANSQSVTLGCMTGGGGAI